MTDVEGSAEQSSQQGRHTPPRRAGTRRSADSGQPSDQGYSADMAHQVGEAVAALAQRLVDPSVAHSVEEVEHVMRGFSTTVEGMADGIGGVTEWLRAAGHAGALSGHASVVSERMVHISRELERLADAARQAHTSEWESADTGSAGVGDAAVPPDPPE